jgi:hypothetical protein
VWLPGPWECPWELELEESELPELLDPESLEVEVLDALSLLPSVFVPPVVVDDDDPLESVL